MRTYCMRMIGTTAHAPSSGIGQRFRSCLVLALTALVAVPVLVLLVPSLAHADDPLILGFDRDPRTGRDRGCVVTSDGQGREPYLTGDSFLGSCFVANRSSGRRSFDLTMAIYTPNSGPTTSVLGEISTSVPPGGQRIDVPVLRGSVLPEDVPSGPASVIFTLAPHDSGGNSTLHHVIFVRRVGERLVPYPTGDGPPNAHGAVLRSCEIMDNDAGRVSVDETIGVACDVIGDQIPSDATNIRLRYHVLDSSAQWHPTSSPSELHQDSGDFLALDWSVEMPSEASDGHARLYVEVVWSRAADLTNDGQTLYSHESGGWALVPIDLRSLRNPGPTIPAFRPRDDSPVTTTNDGIGLPPDSRVEVPNSTDDSNTPPGPSGSTYGAQWHLVVHSSEFDGFGDRFPTLAGEEVIVAIDVERQPNSELTLSAAFTLVDSQGVRHDVEAGRTCFMSERRLRCAFSFYVPDNVEIGEEYQVQWALHGKDTDQRYLAWDYSGNLEIVVAAENCVPQYVPPVALDRSLIDSPDPQIILVNDLQLTDNFLTRAIRLFTRPFTRLFGGDEEELDETMQIVELKWGILNPCRAAARLHMVAKLEPGTPELPQLASVIGDRRRTALVEDLYKRESAAAVLAHSKAQDPNWRTYLNYIGTWDTCEVEGDSEVEDDSPLTVCTVNVKLEVGPSWNDWAKWSNVWNGKVYTLDASVVQEVDLSSSGRVVYRALGHERWYVTKEPGVADALLSVVNKIPDGLQFFRTAWNLGRDCVGAHFGSSTEMWEAVTAGSAGFWVGEFHDSEHPCYVAGEIASGWLVVGDVRAVLYCSYVETTNNECTFGEKSLNTVAFIPLIGDVGKTLDQLDDLRKTVQKLDAAVNANAGLRQLKGLDDLIARTSKANPQLRKQWDDLLDRATSRYKPHRTGAAREIASALFLDQQGYKLVALGKKHGHAEFDKIVEAPDGRRFFVEDRDFHNFDVNDASSKLDHALTASIDEKFVDEFGAVNGYILMVHKSNAQGYSHLSLNQLVGKAEDVGEEFRDVGRNLYPEFDVKYGIMIDDRFWSPPE